MPLRIERRTNRLGNWFIDQALREVLEQHANEDLWFEKQDRIYIGVTRNLAEIVGIFSSWLNEGEVESAKIFARISCQDPKSKKYHIISFYQRQNRVDGGKVVVQAVWLVKKRESMEKIRKQILREFQELVRDPRYKDGGISLREFLKG